jgi:hypothetical protein
MTPQEKARKLAASVNYCIENKLLSSDEKEKIYKGTKEESFMITCKCMCRMERHFEIKNAFAIIPNLKRLLSTYVVF